MSKAVDIGLRPQPKWQATCWYWRYLMIICRRLILILRTAWIRGMEPLAHLLKRGGVNLPTCVTLLGNLECGWPPGRHLHHRGCRSTGFTAYPANERPDEQDQQSNPQHCAQRHQQPAPAKTITPHHSSILTFVCTRQVDSRRYGNVQFPCLSYRAHITFASQRHPATSLLAHRRAFHNSKAHPAWFRATTQLSYHVASGART